MFCFKKNMEGCFFFWMLVILTPLTSCFLQAGINETYTGGSHEGDESTVSSCSFLKDKPDKMKKACEFFLKKHPGSYSLKKLSRSEIENGVSINKGGSSSIYIVPPGTYSVNHHWLINRAKRILILGEPDSKGNYPDLSAGPDFVSFHMISIDGCDSCQVSGFKIDPTFEFEGKKIRRNSIAANNGSNLRISDINSEHFSDYGYFDIRNVKGIELSKVHIEHKTNAEYVSEAIIQPAIKLESCDNIKTDNIKILNLTQTGRGEVATFQIINPIKFEIKNTSIMQHSGAIKTDKAVYVDIHFSDPTRYGIADVDGKIDNLQIEEYVAYKKPGTPYKEWSNTWHKVGLSRAPELDSEVSIRGAIKIQNTDLRESELHGKELFPDLKIDYSPKTIVASLISVSASEYFIQTSARYLITTASPIDETTSNIRITKSSPAKTSSQGIVPSSTAHRMKGRSAGETNYGVLIGVPVSVVITVVGIAVGLVVYKHRKQARLSADFQPLNRM